jgi:hypothetical protein
VGLVLEASTQAAGVTGTAATWVAPTGTPATRHARALGCGGRTSCGCVDTVCARSPRGPGPCFGGGGARCAAWPIVKAPLKKQKKAERRDAQDEFHRAAQEARAWADGDFDADHGFAFDGVGRPAH